MKMEVIFKTNTECGFLGGCSQATTYEIHSSNSWLPIAVININEVLSISKECE